RPARPFERPRPIHRPHADRRGNVPRSCHPAVDMTAAALLALHPVGSKSAEAPALFRARPGGGAWAGPIHPDAVAEMLRRPPINRPRSGKAHPSSETDDPPDPTPAAAGHGHVLPDQEHRNRFHVSPRYHSGKKSAV